MQPGDRVDVLLHSSDRLGWVVTEGEPDGDAYAEAAALIRRQPFTVKEPLGGSAGGDETLARLARYANGAR
ncbi:hypothetical protein [Actinoplanes solisilvae]|uniref:hypothetical protein n=1 Tax=Actinoplanes solisilvae TaxID=2486853 RepID=UPI000FDA1EF9|nr:hypothetical protein [Actinoplanes solisilvae]